MSEDPAAEIKPSLGDDFPSVMRQMARLESRFLLIDAYAGRAVAYPQLRQMFKANDCTVVTVREVEVEIPNARTIVETTTSK